MNLYSFLLNKETLLHCKSGKLVGELLYFGKGKPVGWIIHHSSWSSGTNMWHSLENLSFYDPYEKLTSTMSVNVQCSNARFLNGLSDRVVFFGKWHPQVNLHIDCRSRLSLTGSRGTGDAEGGGGAGGVNGLNMHMEPSQELKIKTVPKSRPVQIQMYVSRFLMLEHKCQIVASVATSVKCNR